MAKEGGNTKKMKNNLNTSRIRQITSELFPKKKNINKDSVELILDKANGFCVSLIKESKKAALFEKKEVITPEFVEKGWTTLLESYYPEAAERILEPVIKNLEDYKKSLRSEKNE